MHLAQLVAAALAVFLSCLQASCSVIPEVEAEHSPSSLRRGLYARQQLGSVEIGLNFTTTQAAILPVTLSSDRQWVSGIA